MTGWTKIRESGSNETIHGYINNFSKNGACLCARQALSQGAAITLTFHFYKQQTVQTVSGVDGSVVWSNKKDPFSIVGISFKTPVTKKNYPALFEYLEKALKSSDQIMVENVKRLNISDG